MPNTHCFTIVLPRPPPELPLVIEVCIPRYFPVRRFPWPPPPIDELDIRLEGRPIPVFRDLAVLRDVATLVSQIDSGEVRRALEGSLGKSVEQLQKEAQSSIPGVKLFLATHD